MASALRTSEAGLKLIMAYEGFRSHSARLPDGRWVIGYGHMRAARAGLKVSQPEAAAILREFDLPPVEAAILELVLVALNQNEFDALVSLAFNIGTDQFESSDVLAALNSGDRMGAARRLERWCKAKVGPRSMVVDPLVRRRADEKALFLKPVGTVPLAASSRFRPMPAEMQDDAGARGHDFTIQEDGPAGDAGVSGPDETATEAAARNVKERLTRILGEYEASMPTAEAEATTEPQADEDGDEESVEQIRAAISALVADDEPSPEGAHGLDELDVASDLDADAFDIESGNLQVDPPRAPRKGLVYIDDVSEIEIPPADPDLRRSGDAGNAAEMAVFAVIALLGALIFLTGGAFGLGWFGVSLPGDDGRLGYLPPFLMLMGALVFIVMSYYWARAVFSRR